MQDTGFGPGLLTFSALAALGSLALGLTRHGQTLKLQLTLFLTAFALRYAFSVVTYQFGLVEVLRDEDASGWVNGVTLVRMWQDADIGVLGLPSAIAESSFQKEAHWGYYYTLAVYFFFTGATTRLPAAALNCFIGSLTVILVYRTSSTLFSSRVARLAGWLTCLWPSLIVWSGQTLKEPSVIFLESLVLYCCVTISVRKFSLHHVVVCVVAAVVVMPFRFYASYLAGLAIVITFTSLFIDRQRLDPRTARIAAMVLALVISGITIAFARSEARAEGFTRARAQEFRQAVAVDQGSGVTMDYDLATPTGLTMSLLVGGVHLLLAPFPWQMLSGSTRMLLTAPEVVSWWIILVIGVVPGLRYATRFRLIDAMPLFIFIAGLGVLYSMTFGNVGLAYRQRAQLLPWLLVLAAVGLEQKGRVIARTAAPALGRPRVFAPD